MFRSVVKEQLKVPAQIDYLGDLRDFVTKVGKRHGIPDRIINAFKLSIDEAATNIIKHAYRDWEGDITIRAIVKKQSLTILLIDQGKYFDPRQVNDPDLQRYVEIGKKGGLGIFIMRRLLDSIDYRKTEEGNELVLTKYFEEGKKARFSVPSIPLTLKARYWLIAMAVFTIILAAAYGFYFFRVRKQVLNTYLDQGRNACSYLAGEIFNNMSALSPAQQQELQREGTYDLEVLESAARPIHSLTLSKHSELMHSAFVVDNFGRVLASSDRDFLQPLIDRFETPGEHRYLDSDVVIYTLPDGPDVIDIVYTVRGSDQTQLCKVHFLLGYDRIREEIVAQRFDVFKVVLLVLAVGAAGLFLLVYVVMNPFRRLAEWVKQMGQPGIVDEMDIDSSTEVGEIAKAFSDITQKLRVSQENLAEQERLQKEMQVAQEIQQTLLPSEFPEIEGYQIASYYEAAKEVGGDYFDFVEVDKDSLGIVVGDVSGKGVPGSLVMTMIRTALRTEARGVKDAAEVLARVNDFIVNDMKKGMFVTLFYVIIDSRRRRLNYASAGHNPMILFRPSTNKTYYLNPRGFPIGISLPDNNLFRNSIESDTLSLAEDDILIVYTDGITEAMNGRRNLFGEERFLQAVRSLGRKPAAEFVENLQQEILSFTEGNPQNDDITLVCIKEKTTAEKLELKRAKEVYSAVQQGASIKDACEEADISTYAYNKYKETFETKGIEADDLLLETEPIEARHLSIEEKTKIFDIIRRYPEYGAKRISEELKSDYYGNLEISTARIYEELVRSRLNTRELREAFVMRGGRKRKRIKPPGTPMLTIDGRVIIQKTGFRQPGEEEEEEEEEEKPPAPVRSESLASKPVEKKQEPSAETPVAASTLQDSFDLLTTEPIDLFSTGLENLLDKRKTYRRSAPKTAEEKEIEYEASESALEPEAEEEYTPEALFPTDQWVTEDAEEPPSKTDVEEEELAGLDVESLPKVNSAPSIEDDIDIEPRPEEEIDAEELDFVQLIQMGEGLEEPRKKLSRDTSLVDRDSAEDADVVSENDSGADENFFLEEAFNEFVEMGQEGSAIGFDGDFDSEITEQILQSEIDRQLRDSKGDWQVVEPDTVNQSEANGDRRLDFDDLIELLDQHHSRTTEGSGEAEKTAVSAGGMRAPRLGMRDSQMMQIRRFFDAENFEKTIDAARSFLLHYPDDGQVYLLLGHAYYQTQQYREAAQVYENVLKMDPRNVGAYENLGVAYANQGDFLRAVEKWERLLKIAPERSDIRKSIERAKKFLQ
ncbi:SpoIIE family protein phosphatase [candidate division KSB1 bacterium]|nr:SpoIIE family protein phosphatase [candidate division KSB1 bacterium]